MFSGKTSAPARDFVAEQFEGYERILLPCVGRWTVATAVAARYGAERIEASDLCLFSSIIGYLADPRHQLDELGITVPPEYQPLVAGATDEYQFAAGAMLAIKLLTLPAKHVHGGELRREIWDRRNEHRERVAEGLREQVGLLKGCRYDAVDVRHVMTHVDLADATTALFVNPKANGKAYNEAEAHLWEGPAIGEIEADEPPYLLDLLTHSKGLATAYVHHDEWEPPIGWTKLAAFGGKRGRTDYVIANHDTTKRLTTGQFDRGPMRWPVFTDDDIITPDTQIGFVIVDKYTCLHYRDLFVHRLGQTESEVYGLMLLDGKVVTAFGLHAQKLRIGVSKFLFESFGITVTTNRYARLGKLFMLLLTSVDFLHWLMAQSHGYQSHPPIGIRTASPTQHHEGKTDRSVMKLVGREPRPDGGFQLVYEAPFRDESFTDALNRWLKRWGTKTRPGWIAPEPETAA